VISSSLKSSSFKKSLPLRFTAIGLKSFQNIVQYFSASRYLQQQAGSPFEADVSVLSGGFIPNQFCPVIFPQSVLSGGFSKISSARRFRLPSSVP
jgi:hypothetical protein